MKSIHKVIRDELFERDIHLFVGTGKQLTDSGLYEVSDVETQTNVAMSIHCDTREIIWINAGINRDMLRSLVHEAVHVAVYVMSQCGVPQGEDDKRWQSRKERMSRCSR
jgi:hypothetical protein